MSMRWRLRAATAHTPNSPSPPLDVLAGCLAARNALAPPHPTTCAHTPPRIPSPPPTQLLVKLLPALVQKLSTAQPKTRAKVCAGAC
jgi:hypothetical protein